MKNNDQDPVARIEEAMSFLLEKVRMFVFSLTDRHQNFDKLFSIQMTKDTATVRIQDSAFKPEHYRVTPSDSSHEAIENIILQQKKSQDAKDLMQEVEMAADALRQDLLCIPVLSDSLSLHISVGKFAQKNPPRLNIHFLFGRLHGGEYISAPVLIPRFLSVLKELAKIQQVGTRYWVISRNPKQPDASGRLFETEYCNIIRAATREDALRLSMIHGWFETMQRVDSRNGPWETIVNEEKNTHKQEQICATEIGCP